MIQMRSMLIMGLNYKVFGISSWWRVLVSQPQTVESLYVSLMVVKSILHCSWYLLGLEVDSNNNDDTLWINWPWWQRPSHLLQPYMLALSPLLQVDAYSAPQTDSSRIPTVGYYIQVFPSKASLPVSCQGTPDFGRPCRSWDCSEWTIWQQLEHTH